MINRGNYRRDVFGTAGAAQAFERVVGEAAALHGWRLQADVVMSNHYHLAVETARANRVQGMRWWQGTFSVRFNRLRNERGRLFEGRYKSLIVDPDEGLGPLCHYLHLNPSGRGCVSPPNCRDNAGPASVG